MSNRKPILTAAVVLFVLVMLVAATPGRRNPLARFTAGLSGWTASAQRSDPVGYVLYLERLLKRDRAALVSIREELKRETDRPPGGAADREPPAPDATPAQTAPAAPTFEEASRFDRAAGAQAPSQETPAQTGISPAQSDVKPEVESKDEAIIAKRQVVSPLTRTAEELIDVVTAQIDDIDTEIVELETQLALLEDGIVDRPSEKIVQQAIKLLSSNANMIEADPVRTLRRIAAANRPARPEAKPTLDK